MAKIITVVGATGVQGGSVIRALLSDPSYTLRAITRNAQSPAATALSAQGVEVVEADLANPSSLKVAFKNSNAIFAVTNFFETLPTLGISGSGALETQLGINLADAAAATDTLEHYIWSTLPNSRKNTAGKVVVPYYESKNRVDDYIKTSLPELARKTTFLRLAWYAGNIEAPIFKPFPIPGAAIFAGSQRWIQVLGVSPSVRVPMLGDEHTNIGCFVKATLKNPEKSLPAKTVAGFTGFMSYEEVMALYSEVSGGGRDMKYVQVSKEDYLALWGDFGELIQTSNQYLELMGEKSQTSVDEVVVGKEELGVEGLVETREAFAATKLDS